MPIALYDPTSRGAAAYGEPGGGGWRTWLGPSAWAEASTPSFRAPREQAASQFPIDRIRRNPHQPRTAFDEEELAELATSIAEHGVLQPIVVRGERGW